jgi:DNA-binding response OmpR family regulator
MGIDFDITTYSEPNLLRIVNANGKDHMYFIKNAKKANVVSSFQNALEEDRYFQVDTFNDTESAIVTFKPDLYDLALLDIRMPGTSGFQLWRKLREMDKNLKICFLTATELIYFEDIESDVINDIGTDCFLAKPVNTIDLMNRPNVILLQE